MRLQVGDDGPIRLGTVSHHCSHSHSENGPAARDGKGDADVSVLLAFICSRSSIGRRKRVKRKGPGHSDTRSIFIIINDFISLFFPP